MGWRSCHKRYLARTGGHRASRQHADRSRCRQRRARDSNRRAAGRRSTRWSWSGGNGDHRSDAGFGDLRLRAAWRRADRRRLLQSCGIRKRDRPDPFGLACSRRVGAERRAHPNDVRAQRRRHRPCRLDAVRTFGRRRNPWSGMGPANHACGSREPQDRGRCRVARRRTRRRARGGLARCRRCPGLLGRHMATRESHLSDGGERERLASSRPHDVRAMARNGPAAFGHRSQVPAAVCPLVHQPARRRRRGGFDDRASRPTSIARYWPLASGFQSPSKGRSSSPTLPNAGPWPWKPSMRRREVGRSRWPSPTRSLTVAHPRRFFTNGTLGHGHDGSQRHARARRSAVSGHSDVAGPVRGELRPAPERCASRRGVGDCSRHLDRHRFGDPRSVVAGLALVARPVASRARPRRARIPGCTPLAGFASRSLTPTSGCSTSRPAPTSSA